MTFNFSNESKNLFLKTDYYHIRFYLAYILKQLKVYKGWRNFAVECNDTWWFSIF